jgi:F420-dependent oxidoreductase-like protein
MTIRVGVALGLRATPYWPVEELRAERQRAVAAGVDSAWLSQGVGADALTMIASFPQAPVEDGVAVVPIQTRHPLAVAEQAATVAALVGRFALGLGLGHRELLGEQYGIGGPRRVAVLDEYLQLLGALLAGEEVDHRGTAYRVHAQLALPVGRAPELLVAALGDSMLELAGRRSAGTIVWRTGPRTIERHVVPRISSAAGRHGKPAPRIVVGLPFVVTDHPEEARRIVDTAEAFALTLPSYRDAFAREGVERPSDLALIGGENAVAEKAAALEAAGATDLVAVLHAGCDNERALALLASLSGKGAQPD